MKKILRKLDRRFHLTRPGSVLILVVALLVLLALMGTAFLSSSRVDRQATVQHTNNTEIDLLLEGVKNMAKATVVGSLNDPSLPFPYRPANSILAKTWDMPDMFHQYTNDPLISTTANDAWLSPRCPVTIINGGNFNGVPYVVVWPCLGEPLTGNQFESPIVLPSSGTGNACVAGIPLTYTDRMTGSFNNPSIQVKGFVPPPAGSTTPPNGSVLMPAFSTINYQDGTSANIPSFAITNSAGVTYSYAAGDADGDGIADSGLFKLGTGPINGVTYYAAVRIIDNCAAINVNTAVSRRYDFNGSGVPTRVSTGPGTNTYTGVYNLSSFPSNVGLAELLQTYDGASADNATGSLGTEFGAWLAYHLGNRYVSSPQSVPSAPATPIVVPSESDVEVHPEILPAAFPIPDTGVPTVPPQNFCFTTLGDMLSSQIGRRPTNPGYASSTGTLCLAATDTDAAALAYHFVFCNPSAARTPLEQILHSSLCDSAPNGAIGPFTRGQTGATAGLNTSSTAYSGSSSNWPTILADWYADNFDWTGDMVGTNYAEGQTVYATANAASAGQNSLPRRSILTASSAVSNLTPQPTWVTTPSYQPAVGMSNITSTPPMCKASINTAQFSDLWRAFWLSMTADYGLSPLGTNTGATPASGYAVPSGYFDHNLAQGQSIYTGSQFTNPLPAGYLGGPGTQASSQFVTPLTDPQHPQAMFRSTLRNPSAVYYQTGQYSYIEADQMVLLRSAIAAANATAMRYTAKGSTAPIFAYDVPLKATISGTVNQPVYARVYGVSQQPYITEVYVNTNTQISTEASTSGKQNTKPYVAIELFNPYGTSISLAGWQLAKIDRSPTSTSRAPQVIHTFGTADVVPFWGGSATGTVKYQGGYALLEDLNATGVNYRPASTRLDPTATANTAGTMTYGQINDIFVPELADLIPSASAANPYANAELVLLRPVSNTGVAEASIDQVPVDSYDFTGLTYNGVDNTVIPPLPVADVWHYVRGNALDVTNNKSNSLWRFIYPGRYDASDPTPYASTAASAAPAATVATGSRAVVAAPAYVAWSRRQQGTQASHWRSGATFPPASNDPFTQAFPPTPNVTFGGTTNPAADNLVASYPVTFPFQYLNNDQPGEWPLVPSSGPGFNMAPFGQFARNSDILQVPFVGSYVIFTAAPTGNPATGKVDSASLTSIALTAADMQNMIEINPLPMDCSFAEDTDLTDDPPTGDAQVQGNTGPFIWNESVGHFAPVNTTNYADPTNPGNNNLTYRMITALPAQYPQNPAQTIADSDPTLAYTSATDPYAAYKVQFSGDAATQKYWRYHWASRVFDYLTVQNPSDDYFPNVQQAMYNTFATGDGAPLPVQNTAGIFPGASTQPANPDTENAVPVYGLININTAPWRVLSALRLCPYDDAELDTNSVKLAMQFNISPPSGTVASGNGDGFLDNLRLAQAIVQWRDFGQPSNSNVSSQVNTTSYPYGTYKGPFTSISDLLNVPAVQSYLNLLTNPTDGTTKGSIEPNNVEGHLSPNQGQDGATPQPLITDGVRNDVEERFDLLSRLSNQITTKSDVYTVYIVIQGWRNAGSSNASSPPQMVTQRRAAFILDRSSVTPTSSNVKTINVPTD